MESEIMRYVLLVTILILLYFFLKPLYPYVAGCKPLKKPADIKESSVKIKDLNVYYLTAGDPQNPPLVFLHGTGGSQKMSRCRKEQIMTALSRDFYVYLPLHPGASKSDLPTFPWKTKDYVSYLNELLDQLKIEKPIMMGQSFGGRIGFQYAIEHSEKIRLLVLGDPAIRLEHSSFYQDFLLSIAKPILSFVFYTSWIPTSLKSNLSQLVLSVPAEAILNKDFSKLRVVIDIISMREIFSKEDIGKITVPTILIWGKYDYQFPISRARELDRLIPNSTLYEYEGGHTAMYEDIEQTQKIILNGLKESTNGKAR